MSYTPERFMADSGITRDEVEAEKRRMLEEIRLYELKEAPQGRTRHPEAIGAGPGGQPEEDKRHRVGRRGPYQGGHAETLSRRHRRNIDVTASLPGGKELRLV